MCLVDFRLSSRTQLRPGLTRQNFQKSTFFFESIFGWFFHAFYLHFGMIFGRFFIEFTFLFRALFLEDFLIDVSLFLHSFFFGEPSPTRVLLGKYYGSRTCTFFEKRVFSCEANPKIIKMQVRFRIVFSLISLTFSASISAFLAPFLLKFSEFS